MLDRFLVDAQRFPGTVLVTGAGGCIGSWVIATLVRSGVAVAAFDLTDDKRRPRLLLQDDELARVRWMTGDIADTAAVRNAVETSGARAIIHLAALQVPFCKADPAAGARANVVGTVNVFEAARLLGINRIAYASSVAAYGALEDGGAMPTLYGAYKYCDEQIAKVYSLDWGIHSLGIRPGVVYGVGRDQGLTSKTTVAILAAAAGVPYQVPFRGPVSWLYTGEVAAAFIASVARACSGSPVFDMNGVYAPVEDGLAILRRIAPDTALSVSGDVLAFPMDRPDQPLHDYLGGYAQVSLEQGVTATYQSFRALLDRGLVKAESVA
jgi:nucleoside-diphosphate-sugar epimerase